jgi:hypothetical protein
MSTWTSDYGTCVLCTAVVFAWIAVAAFAWVDKWERTRREYVSKWHAEPNHENHSWHRTR